jgi:hypothetical protein
LTPEFLKEFQNSEYEVHQIGPNKACSQNFSFLELNTAELAAPQILSKNFRQRRTLGETNTLVARNSKNENSQNLLKYFFNHLSMSIEHFCVIIRPHF